MLRVEGPGDIPNALNVAMDRGGLLLDEAQLGPTFFDLTTGFAGELFQKFTNYRAKLAIVVANPNIYGARFGELVHEHRTHGCVRFFTGVQDARRWLAYNPIVKC